MADLATEVIEGYQAFAPVSRALAEEARIHFPGGDTRMSASDAPYPLAIERAEGCRLHDADGHVLLDFMNNFTSLIHGHAYPPVVAAVNEQIRRGSAYAAPTRSQVALARILRERIPSLE